MPTFAPSRFARHLLFALALVAASLHAQEAKTLAPGFSVRPVDSRLLLLPADMELYSMSAGGVVEPRADWTDAAQKHFSAALAGEGKLLGPKVSTLSTTEADEFADIVTLHRAVAD